MSEMAAKNKQAGRIASEHLVMITASGAEETARLQASEKNAFPNSILALSADAIRALPKLQAPQQLQPDKQRRTASEYHIRRQLRGELLMRPLQLFSSHNGNRLLSGMQDLTIGAPAVVNAESPRPSGK